MGCFVSAVSPAPCLFPDPLRGDLFLSACPADCCIRRSLSYKRQAAVLLTHSASENASALTNTILFSLPLKPLQAPLQRLYSSLRRPFLCPTAGRRTIGSLPSSPRLPWVPHRFWPPLHLFCGPSAARFPDSVALCTPAQKEAAGSKCFLPLF